jgi:hypothetical protein
MRQAVAIGVGVAVVVAGLVVLLSQREQRLAGGNSRVIASAVAVPVAPGRDSCTKVPFLPTKVSSARVYPGTYGGPGSPLELTIRWGGRTVSSARVSGGYGNAPLEIPVRAPRRELVEPVVCMRNAGSRRVRFAGHITPLNAAAAQGRGGDRIRYDFLRPGRESWWGLSGTVAARFSRLKPSFVGSWTMWALFGVMAALWPASILILRRESR